MENYILDNSMYAKPSKDGKRTEFEILGVCYKMLRQMYNKDIMNISDYFIYRFL